MSSFNRKKELFLALAQAENLSGIFLTNTDPEADWYAIVEKNKQILKQYNLSIIDQTDKLKNGYIKVEVILLHEKSGQNIKSEISLNNNLEVDSPDVFLFRRILYEGLLGIASSNNAIEAELFGPKRKHKEFATYDNTANFIEFEYFVNGKKHISRQNRREFELLFLGMTSEDEAKATFEIPIYRRFSWSNIKLFLRCKRCFYYNKKFNVKLDDFDDARYGLEKVTETLLKSEFDRYRNLKMPHPIMKGKELVRPLNHKKINEWRTAWGLVDKYSIHGVQYHDVLGNWMVYGSVDDIWLNDKKELIIVDYKSSTNDKIYPEYRQQLEFYAWIFKKRNYKVSPIGYLLFYQPITKRNTFDWRLDFESRLIDVTINDSWVQQTIDDALECLSLDVQPATGLNMLNGNNPCNLCHYFDRLTVKLGLKK
jgi:hypothetical protein